MSDDFAVALGLKESSFAHIREFQANMTEEERVQYVYGRLLVRLRMEPQEQQDVILSRFTAIWLLKLLERWRASDDPGSVYSLLLPHISDNVYFQVFLASGHPAAKDMTLHYAQRLAKATWSRVEDSDMVFDACQHLSTMLVYEDSDTVLPRELTDVLIDKISAWQIAYAHLPNMAPLPRAIGLLKRQVSWVREGRKVKEHMERVLMACNKPGCTVPYVPGTDTLQQCSGCKTARYCSPEHQRQHWKTHKLFCFRPAWTED